jgi:hypothetical protein
LIDSDRDLLEEAMQVVCHNPFIDSIARLFGVNNRGGYLNPLDVTVAAGDPIDEFLGRQVLCYSYSGEPGLQEEQISPIFEYFRIFVEELGMLEATIGSGTRPEVDALKTIIERVLEREGQISEFHRYVEEISPLMSANFLVRPTVDGDSLIKKTLSPLDCVKTAFVVDSFKGPYKTTNWPFMFRFNGLARDILRACVRNGLYKSVIPEAYQRKRNRIDFALEGATQLSAMVNELKGYRYSDLTFPRMEDGSMLYTQQLTLAKNMIDTNPTRFGFLTRFYRVRRSNPIVQQSRKEEGLSVYFAYEEKDDQKVKVYTRDDLIGDVLSGQYVKDLRMLDVGELDALRFDIRVKFKRTRVKEATEVPFPIDVLSLNPTFYTSSLNCLFVFDDSFRNEFMMRSVESIPPVWVPSLKDFELIVDQSGKIGNLASLITELTAPYRDYFEPFVLGNHFRRVVVRQ